MIDYVEALERVRAELEPTWQLGTFHLDDRLVMQTEDFYVFKVGAREALLDGDLSYARFGGGVPAVLKTTGDMVWIPEVRLAADAVSLVVQEYPANSEDPGRS